VQCQVCPNECLLEPEDRGRCRNKVHKEGKLWTLAYADPVALHVDPIEKKPLFHFHPGSSAFSMATAGCSFRCLNCQNWEISQKKPEELKTTDAPALHLPERGSLAVGPDEIARLTLEPDAVVAAARATGSRSIAYTYAEPISFLEYMLDTARAARAAGLKNVAVTNGYLLREAGAELATVLDAANVDLKGFDEEGYRKLNAGHLAPVLETLRQLHEAGVWLEVSFLVVPGYADDLVAIGRLADWLVEHLGPDVPLHFLRFVPKYQLEHLPPTPIATLRDAARRARAAGVRFVYLGNARGVPDATTTRCPGCGRVVVARDGFALTRVDLDGAKCRGCGRPLPGVWSA
jgi:pyruvate formate lyase activating enzyme